MSNAILVLENMIGLKVMTLGGTKERIVDVTASGYKLANRRQQVKAIQLVKVGRNYQEIERPSTKLIEDSGQGYAIITDPDLYLKVHGKAMKGSKKKSTETKVDKKEKKTKPSKEEKKSKSSKEEKKSKSSKEEKKTKPSKEKVIERDDLELLGDFGNRVPEGLRSVIALSIKKHLSDNFNLPGEVRVESKVKMFDGYAQDGGVGCVTTGIFFDLPVVTQISVTAKTMESVNVGLWERKEKLRSLCFKRFGSDFNIHDVFIDEEDEEYIFAGATRTKKKKPLLVFHRPASETCIVTEIDSAVERLSLAPIVLENSEDDLDLSDFPDDTSDLSDSSDLELVDGDELEEATSEDRSENIEVEELQNYTSRSELVEMLTENYTVNEMVDFANSQLEDLSKKEKRILKSKDAEAIATMFAEVFVEEEEEPVANDESDDFGDFGDKSDASDAESDSSDIDFVDDGKEEIDLGEDSDEDENSEEDIDIMLDALIADEVISEKDARKLSRNPIKLRELYNDHFEEEETEEEAVEVDADDACDYLVSNDHLTTKKARRMSDEELVALYNSVVNIGGSDSDDSYAETVSGDESGDDTSDVDLSSGDESGEELLLTSDSSSEDSDLD